MADKEQKEPIKTQQQPAEKPESGNQELSLGGQDRATFVESAELLKAYGIRPSTPVPDTDPRPGTSQPINKAADLTEEAGRFSANDSDKRVFVESDRPAPEPSKSESED